MNQINPKQKQTMKLRIITSKLIIVSLSFAGLSITSCSYPGGTGQFVKTRQFGTRTSVRIDEDATRKLLEFNLAPRDEKFARSLAAGDTNLAQKHLTPGNVNKPIDGVPPLGLAAARGSTQMVDMLLANGANPKVISRNGYSAARIAASNGHPTLARKLVSEGAGTNEDVQNGSNVYAANQARVKQQNQQAMAFGLAVIGAMMSSNSGGSEGAQKTCTACGRNMSPYSNRSQCDQCISLSLMYQSR